MSNDQVFEAHRDYLIGVCYRMLGSVADAEDVVQESYLRWHQAGNPTLEKPRAWLTRVSTRICLDRIKSLQSKREHYPGQWLPEPIVNPANRSELDEAVSMALMLAVQQLSPKERATFILHDVFGYTFQEVAETLDLSDSNCRQLAVRARGKLREVRSHEPIDTDQLKQITGAFFQAIDSGDIEGLKQILAEEVVLISDGGGIVPAVPKPIEGRDLVHRFLKGIFQMAKQERSITYKELWFNGGPGMLVSSTGVDSSAFQFSIHAGRIRTIFVQRNPEKLSHLENARP